MPIYPWLDFYILLPHKLFVSIPIMFLCSLAGSHRICNTFQKRLLQFLLIIFFTSVAAVGRTKLRQFAPAIWLVAKHSKFLLTQSTSQNTADPLLQPGWHHRTNIRADFPHFQGFCLTQPICSHSEWVFRMISSKKSHAFCMMWGPGVKHLVWKRRELESSLCYSLPVRLGTRFF